jgi:hypothetical protein
MVAWVRTLGDAAALVVLNNGEAPATLRVDAPEVAGRILRSAPLPGDEAPLAMDVTAGAVEVALPARRGRVFFS